MRPLQWMAVLATIASGAIASGAVAAGTVAATDTVRRPRAIDRPPRRLRGR